MIIGCEIKASLAVGNKYLKLTSRFFLTWNCCKFCFLFLVLSVSWESFSLSHILHKSCTVTLQGATLLAIFLCLSSCWGREGGESMWFKQDILSGKIRVLGATPCCGREFWRGDNLCGRAGCLSKNAGHKAAFSPSICLSSLPSHPPIYPSHPQPSFPVPDLVSCSQLCFLLLQKLGMPSRAEQAPPRASVGSVPPPDVFNTLCRTGQLLLLKEAEGWLHLVSGRKFSHQFSARRDLFNYLLPIL